MCDGVDHRFNWIHCARSSCVILLISPHLFNEWYPLFAPYSAVEFPSILSTASFSILDRIVIAHELLTFWSISPGWMAADECAVISHSSRTIPTPPEHCLTTQLDVCRIVRIKICSLRYYYTRSYLWKKKRRREKRDENKYSKSTLKSDTIGCVNRDDRWWYDNGSKRRDLTSFVCYELLASLANLFVWRRCWVGGLGHDPATVTTTSTLGALQHTQSKNKEITPFQNRTGRDI